MAKEPAPTSRRPYLLRAMHEWMTDNGQTPPLVVDATVEGVVVPRQYVRDGKIVLNVGYSATAGLVMKNDAIGFSARFSGVACDVSLPVQSVIGIYAAETGQGMIFSDDEPGTAAAATTAPAATLVPAPATATADPERGAPSPAGGDEPRRPLKPTGGDEPRRPQLKIVK
ncbi:MAG TPA: ClpXP protease specificity-enhancing factor [Steroidobacteraceae bacterium]|nr:ClpXP protease specificity-enhancing factor [Steroidobacteraceae bacterium]